MKNRDNFIKGNLRLIILSLIYGEPMSGYEIIRRIYDKYGVFESAGSIYPLLYLLEKEGLASVEESGRRKIYHLTEKGIQETEEMFEELCSLVLKIAPQSFHSIILQKLES